MSNGNVLRPHRGNGPQLPQPRNIDEELGDLARSVQRTELDPKQHPALAACKKAAEMVRGLQQRHEAEGETLARQLEQIGEDVLQQCKDAAQKIRENRIIPKEMSDSIATNIENIGETETARQIRVAGGLTAARDAIVGIDAK